jgi:Holliday junction resolvase RusA-like endonuclease
VRIVLKVFVPGKAEPAGSKTAFPISNKDGPVKRANGSQVVVVTDANVNSKPWQDWLKTRVPKQTPLLDGPLFLKVQVVNKRPKGHFGTGNNSTTLKANAPRYKTSKPDTTKLVRGIEDALTGHVWVDDSLIVEQTASKIYGERAGVWIVVGVIE